MSKGKNKRFARKQARAVLKANPLATPKGSLGKLARVGYGSGVHNGHINDTYTDKED